MRRIRLTFLFFLYFLTTGISTKSVIAQSIESSIKQMDEIHKFYKTWAKLYGDDLFRSVYPGQSLTTFGGSQMLSPSAWSIELRGGSISRFPNFIQDEYYSDLDSFRNIKFQVTNISDNKLRFKQYNELLIPEEQIVFTVFDDNGRPINTTPGVPDSTRWRLPSMYQMGMSEGIVPRFNFTLRWAPGYAFEFAGTYRLYDSDPLNNSTVVADNSHRFYNVYLAHDALYWFQSLHMRGWHLTLNAGLSNWNQSVNFNQDLKFFNDYRIGETNVRFSHQINSLDIYNRTTNYGAKFGKSWHDIEVWGGFDYLFSLGGLSDDGSVDAIFDDPNPGFNFRRYREFFFTGINTYQLYNFHLGAMIGQKNIRVGGQYNILSNGTHQASVSVRYVFRDNERHPWQLDKPEEMFFDPTKKRIETKRVIMVRDREDEEYREQKPPESN